MTNIKDIKNNGDIIILGTTQARHSATIVLHMSDINVSPPKPHHYVGSTEQLTRIHRLLRGDMLRRDRLAKCIDDTAILLNFNPLVLEQ